MLARILGSILFVVTVCHVLITVFRDSIDSLRLFVVRRHHIICGYGRIGRQVTKDLLENQRLWRFFLGWFFPRVVVIETRKEHREIARHQLRGGLAVVGDATDEELLETVGLLRAKAIYIATGNDASNVEIAFDCFHLLRQNSPEGDPDRGSTNESAESEPRPIDDSPRLKCYVQLSDPTVREGFRKRWEEVSQELLIQVREFNPATNSGRQLVFEAAEKHRPACPEEVALYVLIGFGPAGKSMALQIAELAHFENHKRTRMLIVEQDCASVAGNFRAQFGAFTHSKCVFKEYGNVKFNPQGDDWNSRVLRPDCSYRVAEPGVEFACNAIFTERPAHFSDRAFQNMLERVTQEEHVKPVVIVCSENDRENLEIASVLADSLIDRCVKPLPFYVWLPDQPSLDAALTRRLELARAKAEKAEEVKAKAKALEAVQAKAEDTAAKEAEETPEAACMETTPPLHCTLHPFGKCEDSASLATFLDPKVERIAKAIRRDYNSKNPPKAPGPPARSWEMTTETDRRWNICPAAHAIIKRIMADHLKRKTGVSESDMIEMIAETEHNRWMAERLLDGWRFNPDDQGKKKHRQTLVPWNHLDELDLPDETSREKTKDRDQTLLSLRETALDVSGQSSVR
ncbi:potassium transporter peripheral membrane component [Lignipirellula cremea]|uniref:Potassium transporter peripheral membrane component n=2 Tax=Lignipirellula cremea TaxID=2528010 RepID=A0A518DVH5_9BACT|nr:potassium transporter peripheral membrane component [Lignipirellula cremea]